jgi:hypothetical protein
MRQKSGPVKESAEKVVKDLRREASALKEVGAELTLENRLLKKTYGPPRLQVIFFEIAE